MGLRFFCAGWRTVVFPLACRTAVFDAMFRAGIPLSRERMRGESLKRAETSGNKYFVERTLALYRLVCSSREDGDSRIP